ncbi:MAG: twin-arginine translocase subunit TatC [Acidimicrobiia bacterium]|jgi:sec-independent protein translocase protein TatC
MSDDRPQPILEHLGELRWRIVRSGIAVVAASLFALLFADRIKAVLERPYVAACARCELQVFGATEQFSTLMKLAFFGGIILASPVILYQTWAFINPALTSRERKWALPIIGACVVLFGVGIVFGYWVMPRGLEFLLNIFPDVRTDLRLVEYFSFAIRFLLAFGLSFLYPVFLFAAAAAGLVTAEQLARGRRYAVLIIVIAAALITPTGDALTLALLSIPLYLFYEITYWLVRLLLRR